MITVSRTSTACETCPSHCCTNKFGYQSVALTDAEAVDPLFAPHLNAGGSLKLEGRHCMFLSGPGGRCTIYNRRPAACRGFVCHDPDSQDVGTFAMVYRNRKLRAHLAATGDLPKIGRDAYWAEDARRVPTMARSYPMIELFRTLSAGTWRFYKLEAETGNVVFLGRRRSTKKSYEGAGKWEKAYHEKHPRTFDFFGPGEPPVCRDEGVGIPCEAKLETIGSHGHR